MDKIPNVTQWKTEQQQNYCCLRNGTIKNLMTIHFVRVRMKHTHTHKKSTARSLSWLFVWALLIMGKNSPHNNWITNRETVEHSNVFDTPALIKCLLTLKRFSFSCVCVRESLITNLICVKSFVCTTIATTKQQRSWNVALTDLEDKSIRVSELRKYC